MKMIDHSTVKCIHCGGTMIVDVDEDHGKCINCGRYDPGEPMPYVRQNKTRTTPQRAAILLTED